MFIYILLLLIHLSRVSFSITISSKGIFPPDRNSAALQFYFEINNENQVPCRVATRFKRCCSTNEQDCNSMFLFGSHEQSIMPRGRESFVFVNPSVFHHDKRGVCYFIVNYKCGRKNKRKLLSIPFDTRLVSMGRKSLQLKRYTGQKVIRNCDSIDEDGLGDCSPVNCIVKYTDEKPFYDVNENKCVRAATCIGRVKNDLPTICYLPDVNLCRDLEHPVELQDIYAINNGMSIVTDTPKYEPELEAVIETNCSTLSQKLGFLMDIISGKMYPVSKGVSIDYSKTCKLTILSILGYIAAICSSVFALVCCLKTLTWSYKKWYNGDIENKWIRLKQKFEKPEAKRKKSEYIGNDYLQSCGRVCGSVKDGLLCDVINRGIPLELRNSAIDVCDRIGKEVRWKKRYRVGQVHAPFECDGDSVSNTSSVDSLRGNTSVTSEEEKLLK